jgi:hypothetical protein
MSLRITSEAQKLKWSRNEFIKFQRFIKFQSSIEFQSFIKFQSFIDLFQGCFSDPKLQKNSESELVQEIVNIGEMSFSVGRVKINEKQKIRFTKSSLSLGSLSWSLFSAIWTNILWKKIGDFLQIRSFDYFLRKNAIKLFRAIFYIFSAQIFWNNDS